jgi:hypothetical protein
MAKVRPVGCMRPSKLFWRPLSLKYLIPHSPFFKKIWLFKPKYDIFEEHFRNLLRFPQICRENFKIILNPSAPLHICFMFGMNLRPLGHWITENGPWVKKSGHPWSNNFYNSMTLCFSAWVPPNIWRLG